jgi:transcriptional regulator with AAA-type ATPase domain
LKNILFQLVNAYAEDQKELKDNDFIDKIKFRPLYEDIKFQRNKNNDDEKEKGIKEIKEFSDFLSIEENFLLKQIDLDDGIGENNLLKENLFLLFLSVITQIPLIIVGKPGTGKSLSSKLIYNAMRGEYSKNDFFKQYPKIIQIYFQGSKSNTPEDVEKLFRKTEKLIKDRKNREKK